MRANHKRSKTPAYYTASIAYDRRLAKYDIAGSVAHARMLAKQGIISEKDAELIIMGLVAIRQEIEQGQFPFKEELEDIHMNIEARLFEKAGDVAGKLHTARSRNDQVAVDVRLFLKDAIKDSARGIRGLQEALLKQAEANRDALMPGYTHLQRAQPILFAHHMLAYFHMLQRDMGRFQDCLRRVDMLPLGSGALAGVPYLVDREFLAKELGFARISENSMDAVADRDFIAEYQATAAITMMHLSRLCEELILWSTEEFGFIKLSNEYTTGSSIMPQKRNPDMAELARGKTGRVYGNLIGILTLLKGLPLTYNRDLQEDKEGLFDTVDTMVSSLEACGGMVESLTVNRDKLAKAAGEGYILATDLADYLVSKGVPFRQAHGQVKALVEYAMECGKSLRELSLPEYQRFSPKFDAGVYEITPQSAVEARDVPGGTSPKQVQRALAQAKRILEEQGGR